MNAKNYKAAKILYTEAIDLYSDASYYGKLSACLFMLGERDNALKQGLDDDRFVNSFSLTIECSQLFSFGRKIEKCCEKKNFMMAGKCFIEDFFAINLQD